MVTANIYSDLYDSELDTMATNLDRMHETVLFRPDKNRTLRKIRELKTVRALGYWRRSTGVVPTGIEPATFRV